VLIRNLTTFLILLLTPLGILAGHFPTRTFTSADGLAGESVNRIVRDSRGFLWFCTSDGLSRFDGQVFKSYTKQHGVPSSNVNEFLESRSGIFYLATSNGLAIFDPKGKAYRWNVETASLEKTGDEPEMFRTIFPPNSENDRPARVIQAVGEDREGRIFVGTLKGLYRLEPINDGWALRRIESPALGPEVSLIEFVTDKFGYMWIVAARGVYRMDPVTEEIEKLLDKGGDSLLADRDGRIWITSGGEMLEGLRVFSFDENEQPFLERTYGEKDGLKLGVFMRDIVQSANGRIFVVDGTQLFEFHPDAEEATQRFSVVADGYFTAVTEDPGGNLWLGTDDRGVTKLFLTGLTIFDQTDGIATDNISSIFLNAANEIMVTLGERKLVRFLDGKFEFVEPKGLRTRSWGSGQLDHQASDGEWWIPSIDGLRHYPKVDAISDLAKISPKDIFTTEDGLYSNEVFNLFEDSRGDIWFSVLYAGDGLLRWERSTGTIHRYTSDDGLPTSNGPSWYVEDRDGSVWVGFFYGGVARYRNGKFEFFGRDQGVPVNPVTHLFRDSRGRIWIATNSRGVFRVDDPTSDTPSFTSISTRDGLSSDQTTCTTEDRLGGIYIGTIRGLNRIDERTGAIRIFSPADGLPGNTVGLCTTDGSGRLWFSVARQLVEFDPQKMPAVPPVPVFIGGLRAGRIEQRISEMGEQSLNGFEFNADQRELQIDYFALGYSNAERLRYQYKINDQEWSALSEQRTVDLNLVPGDYQFAVRAVNSDGVASERPATVAFSIAPPFWQTWTFRAGVVVCIVMVLIWLERLRAKRRRERLAAADALARANGERLKELEQVRRRIATDLHDDIGSSLTQISILSEVLRQRVTTEQVAVAEPLSMIADSSRELVDSMSDIVWAINPQKDHLRDLIQRMRRFASDIFTLREIEFAFEAPSAEVEIGANIRRELFLIFKEAVHNIVKHADCSFVEIELTANDRNIELVVRDNGRGFDIQEAAHIGHGLTSIRARVAGVGGHVEITSDDHGTLLRATVPLLLKSGNGSF